VRFVFDAIYLLALFVTLPRLLRRRRSSWAWRERLLGPRPEDLRPAAAARHRSDSVGSFLAQQETVRIWLHGVSVGEIHALRRMVDELERQRPDVTCLISCTTDTGLAEARRLFPHWPVFRWPLDLSWTVRRTLRRIRPHLIVLAESEWWPNFLLAARCFGIPVVAANVRFSPRTQQRYRRFARLAHSWLQCIDSFLVQTHDYADALAACGIERQRIQVTGSVKYDGNLGDRSDPRVVELKRQFGISEEDVVWVGGSTQPEEEAAILDCYSALQHRYPQLRLILVPRHAERFDEVALQLAEQGIAYVRRTQLPEPRSIGRSVILVDTIGELSAIWGLADIAFVGGSLDGRRGGQNMIEPASFGAAVLFGPHTWNFRETVRQLLASQAACVVRDAADMLHVVQRLLDSPDERRRLGEAARQLVQSQQGASRRVVECLLPFVPSSRASQDEAA
jgi:3-deoxy-D-manno-octulosonic-acid transferase